MDCSFIVPLGIFLNKRMPWLLFGQGTYFNLLPDSWREKTDRGRRWAVYIFLVYFVFCSYIRIRTVCITKMKIPCLFLEGNRQGDKNENQ